MKLVQLSLWLEDDDTAKVQCTHCGHTFNALGQIRARSEAAEQLLLEHPTVRALPSATRRFFAAALDVLLGSERVGMTEIADETGYSTSGTRWQLLKLVDARILEAVPKRDGGTYHQYKLAVNVLNGNSAKTRQNVDSARVTL